MLGGEYEKNKKYMICKSCFFLEGGVDRYMPKKRQQ